MAAAVALYLGHLAADGRSMATIEQARAAVSHFHAAAGMQKADNPARHPVVSEAMRGWRNRAPAPRQADALTSDALARIRELLRLPRRGRRGRVESVETAHRRAALDLAIIGVLADGGLRGCGPEWQSPRPPPALWVKSGPLTPTQELRYSG